MTKKLSFRISILLVVVLSILFFVFNDCVECKYTEKLSRVKGVLSVNDFLVYEDHLSTKLNLNNGDNLFIAEFNQNIFNHTDYLALLSINDIRINCSDENGISISNGFNLIDFMNSYTSSAEVNNIQEVVNNSSKIYFEINKFLPEDGSYSNEIKLLPKNTQYPRLSLRCFRKETKS